MPADDFTDLSHRLSSLEQQAGGAPLLSVAEGAGEPSWEAQIDTPVSGTSSPKGGDWEFL